MTDRTEKLRAGSRWGAAAWAVGVLFALVGLPVAAADRLPPRLATHWSGSNPDGSMPMWAAVVFPALIWAVLVLALALTGRSGSRQAAGPWAGITLLSGGVVLVGAQAAIVHANLDRADWRDAGSVGAGIAITAAAALTAGLLGRLTGRRTAADAGRPAGALPAMPLPDGERLAWLSRTTNRWLHLTAALAGVIAAAAALAGAVGLTGPQWALVAPFALVSVLTLGCSAVQARVTQTGLEVAFGPLGWPVRRWAVHDIAAARAETRTPAQVGGWGYRLSGVGTTVMLRAGECLVVRPRNGPEFAVSVDDAERGAALLNSLATRSQS
ncbi:DUF1648 domain-containing protein [Streptomyces sp. NPDC054840]